MAIVCQCPECGREFVPPDGAVLAGSGWMACPDCFAPRPPKPPADEAPGENAGCLGKVRDGG